MNDLTTSADAYAHYRRLCDGASVLTEAELRVEVRAAGLAYESLDETFWAALLRRPDHRHVPDRPARVGRHRRANSTV